MHGISLVGEEKVCGEKDLSKSQLCSELFLVDHLAVLLTKTIFLYRDITDYLWVLGYC